MKKLELRKNKITPLQGLGNLPELIELYLSENKIKSFAGLDAPNLKILHLRKNIVIIGLVKFFMFENFPVL